jgi:hypothetical protein
MQTQTLKTQVSTILHARIKRMAVKAYAQANPRPVPLGRQSKPYRLPHEVGEMVKMLGRIESATEAELEQMAAFAGSGAVLAVAY